MSEDISEHISELLGSQGQPQIDEGDDQQQDDGYQAQDEAPPPGDDIDSTEPPVQLKKGSKVPLAALQEERTRRQELQDELKSVRDLNKTMEQRFNQMQQLWLQNQQSQQTQQHQQEAQQVPAFIDDPEGHINALKAQFQAEVEQLRAYQAHTMQQQQAAHHYQELSRQASAAEEQFRRTAPDYNDAAQFFAARRTAEYAALGADPVTIQQQLQRDYTSLAAVAANTGQNAAQMLYNLAKAMGYAPGGQGKSSASPAGAQQPQKKPVPQSLSNMAGAPRAPDEEGELTLEAISNLSDAEFDKLWRKMQSGSVQKPKF